MEYKAILKPAFTNPQLLYIRRISHGMCSYSSSAASNKRLRFDDEFTASTDDPLTIALGNMCGFKAGNLDPMRPLYDLIVDMLPDNKVRLLFITGTSNTF